MRKLPEIPLLARRRLIETIKQRLLAVQRRIEQARTKSGETPQEVVLVGVGKGQPLASLQAAWRAGLRTFGENHLQEAEVKAAEMPAAEWHLIGPLQSNKARRAVQCFDVVHSLDRLKIGRLLNRYAGAEGKTLPCFLQVNLAAEESKHGFEPKVIEEVAAELAELPHLDIIGLMAVPPRVAHPEDSRPWFRQLRKLRDRLQQHTAFDGFEGYLSMGMSADFEIAIEEGATHVRIGTVLFGSRQSRG